MLDKIIYGKLEKLPYIRRVCAVTDAKKWFIGVVGGCIGLLVLLALLTYALDPYMRYRKPTRWPAYFRDAYNQVPGILRNFDYDTLIIGSSMCQNFHLSDFQEVLGEKAIKATSPGCLGMDAKTFFEVARRNQPKLKKVYWGIDTWTYNRGFMSRCDQQRYLYSDSYWQDYKYWWNLTVIDDFFKMLKELMLKPEKQTCLNEDRMFAWDYRKIDTGIDAIVANHDSKSEPILPSNPDTRKLYEKALYQTVRENPQIEFFFFFSPNSILFFDCLQYDGHLDDALECKRELVHNLTQFKNVKVFDFQSDIKLITDLDKYKDTTHFLYPTNRMMVESFHNGAFRTDDKTVLKTEKSIREKVKEFQPLFHEKLENVHRDGPVKH